CQILWNNFIRFQCFLDDVQVLRTFAQTDDLSGLDAVGRNVHTFSVNDNMAVIDKLTCLWPCPGKTQTIDKVIKTGLQENHEVFAMNTFHFAGFIEQVAELPLVQAVHIAQLLLLLLLQSEFRHFSALGWAVLPRGIWPLINFFTSTG